MGLKEDRGEMNRMKRFDQTGRVEMLVRSRRKEQRSRRKSHSDLMDVLSGKD